MHELSIAEDIFTTIEYSLGFKSELKCVEITIGPLSGISAEALSFCFSEVAKLRGFGNPQLVINKVKAVANCSRCDNRYEITDFYSTCLECGSFEREIVSGDRCTIDTVELMEDTHV